LAAYHAKKSKKPALIAKTSVVLDIKPWDDETDMDAMLKNVKTIVKEGLLWGASKLVPVGYGINKLRVMCVVEDEKVSIDELCEEFAEFEDFVQYFLEAGFLRICYPICTPQNPLIMHVQPLHATPMHPRATPPHPSCTMQSLQSLKTLQTFFWRLDSSVYATPFAPLRTPL
jgi:translation elongation factor EF-1beta